MNRLHRLLIITAVALGLMAGPTSPAQAAAPSHDGIAEAKRATGIGYSDSVNVSQATAGRRDPTDCANNASVWYRYTATATETINVNTSGSNYNTVLGVYTGKPGRLVRVACRDWSRVSRLAALDLRVEAGTTYHFMVSACCGTGRDGRDFQQPLLLQFHMTSPLRIERLTVAATGTVDRADGDAHVTVSSRCNHAARGRWAPAALAQRVGESFLASGSTFQGTTCGTSTSEVKLTLHPEGDVAFGEGPATVRLRMRVCSHETGTCTRRRITEEVVLAFPQPVTAP